MVPNCVSLPTEYQLHSDDSISHQRRAWRPQYAVSGTLGLILLLVGNRIVPLSAWISGNEKFAGLWRMMLLFAVWIAYEWLYQLLRMLLMRAYCGGAKRRFRFHLFYMEISSEACFNRRSCLLIDVFPTLFLATLTVVLLLLVPTFWFWPIYSILLLIEVQSFNSAFFAWRLFRLPSTLLVQADGDQRRIFLPREEINLF